MGERVVSPTKITAWLDWPRHLTLRTRVEGGQRSEHDNDFGSFSRLLQANVERHEASFRSANSARRRWIVFGMEGIPG